MTDLFLSGPDALRLLQRLRGQHVRGLHARARPSSTWRSTRTATSSATPSSSTCPEACSTWSATRRSLNWLQYNAEVGDYDVTARARRQLRRPRRRARRASTATSCRARPRRRSSSRLTGAPLPEVKFFHMTEFTIAGHRVRGAAARHGRPAGLRAVRAVGGGRGRCSPRSSRPGRSTAWSARAPRRTRRPTSSRVGARRRCPRSSATDLAGYREWLPASARRLTRRQPRLRRHQRLLRDALRHRLRPDGQVRPRLPRPGGARGAGRRTAPDAR